MSDDITVWQLGQEATTIEGRHGRLIDADPTRIPTNVWVEHPTTGQPWATPVLGANADGWAVVADPTATLDLRELPNPNQVPYPCGPISITKGGKTYQRGYQIPAQLPKGTRLWVHLPDDEDAWLAEVIGDDYEQRSVVRGM